VTIRAVVFDYGGVLTTPVRDSIASWLDADGIHPPSFSAVLKEWLARTAADGTPIHLLETGELSPADFEEALAARLVTRTGTPVDPAGILARLFAQLRPDPRMFHLVEQLRGSGIRTALLSNSWGNTYPRERIDALFDPVVISAEVGLRKPHAAIFELTLQRLGLPAGDVVFVDDAEPNLEGARAVGMHGVLHIDPLAVRTELVRLIPGLSPSPKEVPA
jgi:epoxide hydrolase-like predicted phosphatase